MRNVAKGIPCSVVGELTGGRFLELKRRFLSKGAGVGGLLRRFVVSFVCHTNDYVLGIRMEIVSQVVGGLC